MPAQIDIVVSQPGSDQMDGMVGQHRNEQVRADTVSIGNQRSPTFGAKLGPTAGRKGSWGEPPPGQPDLLDANQPCWPFRRCLMKRSFYNK